MEKLIVITLPYHLLHMLVRNSKNLFFFQQWHSSLIKKLSWFLALSTRILFISASIQLYQCISYCHNYGAWELSLELCSNHLVIEISSLSERIIVFFLLFLSSRGTLWTGSKNWKSCLMELSVLELT